MKNIIIFTDGSSRGNPGPGGWGSVVIFPETVKELGGFEKKTTNNRMELTAVIESLFFVNSKLQTTSYKLLIYSDSAYVINGASKWVFGWQARGWKTSTKEDVLNRDLWERLIGIMKGFQIEWKQVEGHKGIPLNERCDEIATALADGANISLYEGRAENYSIKLEVSSSGGYVSQVNNNKTSSGKKAFSYISKVDGEIKIHKTWVECEARVRGKSNTRFKKSFSKEDEERIIKEFGI